MDIQKAIEHARDVAKKKYAEGMLCHANPNDKELDGCIECAREHEQLADWLEKLEQYKRFGTLEEVQEAVERQKAKKPEKKRNVFTHGVESYSYHCPNCKFRFINKDDTGFYSGMKTKFCPDCGQAIDWSEEE